MPETLNLASIDVPDIVFCRQAPSGTSGSDRVDADLANIIANSLNKSTIFIQEKDIPDALQKGSVVVAINPREGILEQFRENKRLLTIGINSYSTYRNCLSCHIALSPCFNPIKIPDNGLPQGTKPLIIKYTYTPSRMKMSEVSKSTADNFPSHPIPKKYKQPKTVAVYFRSPGSRYESRLMRNTQTLSKKDGYKFFVSTGPSSGRYNKMKKHFEKLKGSQYCDYSKHDSQEASSILEGFFSTAEAIVVSNDSVSTLSDAISTGLPVFLLTMGKKKKSLINGDSGEDHIGDRNLRLQLELYKQRRLNIFNKKNIRSDWQPYRHDDWSKIGGRIAKIIRRKQRQFADHPHN